MVPTPRTPVNSPAPPPEAEPAREPQPGVRLDLTLGYSLSDDRLMLTVNEAARLLAVSRSHLYLLIARGSIPSVQIGRSRRIPVRALETWIAGQLIEGQERVDG